MCQQELQDAIDKRLSLNLLIQGVASHTFLTSHHLVRDELLAIDEALVEAYDRLAVSMYLNYWVGDMIPILGRTRTFWRRIQRPDHPVLGHPQRQIDHGRRLGDRRTALALLAFNGRIAGSGIIRAGLKGFDGGQKPGQSPHRGGLRRPAIAKHQNAANARLHTGDQQGLFHILLANNGREGKGLGHQTRLCLTSHFTVSNMLDSSTNDFPLFL